MTTVDTTQPYIVSVDDHVIEPPHTWESRLPAKLRERGPRAGVDKDGGVFWTFNGSRMVAGENTSIPSACVGIPLEKRSMSLRSWDDIRPGCYDPAERVKDMDIDGVIASLCFPSLPGFGGTRFNDVDDKELAFACIQAYNDFQTDEWAVPGRIFPMILLPYWDPQLAVKEIHRCAAKGARAIAFTENPYRQGYPSIHNEELYWDPIFAAAQEAELPLCMHFGSSSWVINNTSPDAPYVVHYALTPLNSMSAMSDWLLCGVFDRFPKLQTVFSESFVGWIPFVLEHADMAWERHFAWMLDKNKLTRKPSEYFASNVSVCLVYEAQGAKLTPDIGVDRVLAEADYPHSDCQWPYTKKILEDYLQHLPAEDQMKVLRTNADKLFHLGLD